MSSYGSEILCNKLEVPYTGVLTKRGYEKWGFVEYSVLAADTTLTIPSGATSYFDFDIEAASTPAATRFVTITLADQGLTEAFNPNIVVMNVAPETSTPSTNLYVAQIQKLSNTSFRLNIQHNDGTTNVTEKVRVFALLFYDA
jgi:hypothetical protein